MIPMELQSVMQPNAMGVDSLLAAFAAHDPYLQLPRSLLPTHIRLFLLHVRGPATGTHHAARHAVACQRRPAGAVQLVHTCRHRVADKGPATVPAAQPLAGSQLTTAFAHSLASSLASSLSCPLVTVALALTSFLTLTFTFAGYNPIPIPIPHTSGCSATTSGPAATRAWHAAPALLSLMVLPTASSNQPHQPMVNHPTRWASALVLRA